MRGITHNSIVSFVKIHILTELIGLIAALATSIAIFVSKYDITTNANTELPYLPIGVLLIVILVLPLYEEFAFRLAIKPTPFNLGLGIIFFLWFVMQFSDSFFNTSLLYSLQSISLIDELAIVLLVGVWAGALMHILCKPRVSTKYVVGSAYITALIFALFHLSNYGTAESVPWYAIFFVLPQLVLGYRFAVTRMKLGFMYAYFSHLLHNFVFLVPTIVLARVFTYEELKQIAAFDISPIHSLVGYDLALFVLATFLLNVTVAVFVLGGIYIYITSQRDAGQRISSFSLHLYNISLPGVKNIYESAGQNATRIYTATSVCILLGVISLSLPYAYSSSLFVYTMIGLSLILYTCMLYLSYNKKWNIWLTILVFLIALGTFGSVYTLKQKVIEMENKTQPLTTSQNADIVVAGVHMKAKIARTETERERGLSGTQSLATNEAMLFVFESAGIHSFWMKDMNYPIDTLWLDGEGKISYIAEHMTPESYTSTYPPQTWQNRDLAQYVLEVHDGFVQKHSLKLGDPVCISLIASCV